MLAENKNNNTQHISNNNGSGNSMLKINKQ